MSNSIWWPVALLAAPCFAGATHAGGGYDFTKLVDHAVDDFGPRTFTCASINESGDVAFKGTRSAPDGLSSWDVIARVNRAGVMTILAEDPRKTQFQFFSSFVSINDSGEVSFTAQRDTGEQGLFSGTGGSVTTHYTSATPALVDGVMTDLAGGNFGRPSINNT